MSSKRCSGLPWIETQHDIERPSTEHFTSEVREGAGYKDGTYGERWTFFVTMLTLSSENGRINSEYV